MSLHQHKLQILAILSANLCNPQPQLVSTSTLAENIDIQLPKLWQILKSMDGMGIIQTDSDLQYSLITRKGLNYLGDQQMDIPTIFQ